MPSFPLVGGGIGFGQTFATSTYGSTLTAHASSANSQGTPVELIASTAYDAHWIEIMAGNPSAAQSYAINILIGAATAANLVPGLTFRGRAANEGGGRWLFPCFIPKGSRIAASVASSSTTGPPTCLVAVNLFNSGIGAMGMPMDVIQYGTLSSSLGVNVDPGGTANTDVDVEITASTTRDHHWLVLTTASTDAAIAAAQTWLIDVLVGTSTGDELVGDMLLCANSLVDVPLPEQVWHMPVFVPRGSRLSVRARCSVNTDGDRDLYVTLHGA
jgi:hypothetical protein